MKEQNGYQKHWKWINQLQILILDVWNLIMIWNEEKITDFFIR